MRRPPSCRPPRCAREGPVRSDRCPQLPPHTLDGNNQRRRRDPQRLLLRRRILDDQQRLRRRLGLGSRHQRTEPVRLSAAVAVQPAGRHLANRPGTGRR